MNQTKTILLGIAIFLGSNLYSQSFEGDWNALLKVYGQELTLILHLNQKEGKWTGTLDSPDQKAFGMPLTSVEIKGNELTFTLTDLSLSYQGKTLQDGNLGGTFRQGTFSTELSFSKSVLEKQSSKRPQEPKAPFPYLSQEVAFKNTKAGIQFSGTLTTPNNMDSRTVPCIILISGSGPQDRNEEILGHKPFLLLADRLTRAGYAVLRYDDRGTGKTDGKFDGATSKDFSEDVVSAMEFLKTNPVIDAQKITLMGHSEGAMIATMVAAQHPDIFGVVSLAGPGILGSNLLKEQQILISKANGSSKKELKELSTFCDEFFPILAGDSIEKKAKAYLEKTSKTNSEKELKKAGLVNRTQWVDETYKAFVNPWMIYFLNYNPEKDLQNIKCHFMAMNGSLDLQVAEASNLKNIGLHCNPPIGKTKKIVSLPGLNHLFQPTKTGSPLEYGEIETTFDENAIAEILLFMNEISK